MPQTRLVLSDVHIPFHDPGLVRAWLDFARKLKPAGVDIIGDVMDCYMLSRFDKNPARKSSFQSELDTARDLLAEIRRAVGPNCDIRYSEGNHENRLKRMLWGRVKEFADLRNLSIPQLLDTKGLGIKYYIPESPYRIGNLWFLHGDVTRKQNFSKSAGGRAADGVARAIGGSVLMGHTHQMGHAMFRSWERELEGYEVGCLCQMNMEYCIGVPPWQQGWAVVHILKGGAFSVEFVRCVEGARRRRNLIYRDKVIATLPPCKLHIGGQ